MFLKLKYMAAWKSLWSLCMIFHYQLITAQEEIPAPVDGSIVNSTFVSNDSCEMLDTKRFTLNVDCINLYLSTQSAAHQLEASSLADCKRVCCDWKEGPCDMVYWDRSQTSCIIMNYYVLTICPPTAASTSSSSTLLLSISNRVITSLRKPLLFIDKDRKKIRKLLGCTDEEFVCDNWNCIEKKYVCDGTPRCSDGSDETMCSEQTAGKGCLSKDGDFVAIGSEYKPFEEADPCKTCICGKQGAPSYCYSATCNPHPLRACSGPQPALCCYCQMSDQDSHTYTDETPYMNLSNAQRLVVSCLSVLVIVALLFFLTRNFVGREQRGVMLHHRSMSPRDGYRENRSTSTWLEMRAAVPPRSRSFFTRYWSQSDATSLFDRDRPPVTFVDPPPSYNTLKPVSDVSDNEATTEYFGEPPPYPPSSVSGSQNSLNGEALSNQTDDSVTNALTTMQRPDEACSSFLPIVATSCEDRTILSSSDTTESFLSPNDHVPAPRQGD